MYKEAFMHLKEWYEYNSILKGGYKVIIKEKLTIFLNIITTSASFYNAIKLFSKLINTI
jgi:hypothetical protein